MPLTHSVAWLHKAAEEGLLIQADQHAPNETGGLLLGYRHTPNEIVITETIGPGPAAVHRRIGFNPDTEWQARELSRRYAEAERRIHYLGDWHTHPGGKTSMSRIDRQTLGVIARYPDARCPRPVMAVLAGGDPWTLAIHQLAPSTLRRRRIELLELQAYG
jgi:integrative and conjugative element protein (TIGR02256 family)